jgi:hypothetical protein
MSVDAHVPSCATQTLSLPIGDVLLRLGVTVLFRHAKVDHMNNCDCERPVIGQSAANTRTWSLTIGAFRPWTANQKVVRFDVTVDEIFLVYRLNSRDLANSVRRQCQQKWSIVPSASPPYRRS